MKYFIGIDGGGTKTKAVLIDSSDNNLACAITSSSNINHISSQQLEILLNNLVSELCDKANLKLNDIDVICGGFAGASSSKIPEYIAALKFMSNTRIYIYSDSNLLINICSKIEDNKEGIIINVGTGSFAAGFTSDGKIAINGGWGNIIGDVASGHYLGIETIKAAVKESDENREGIFCEIVKKRFSIQKIKDVINILYTDKTKSSDIALLAIDLVEIAEMKNKFASSIINRGLIELKFLIKSLESKLTFETFPINLILTGGLFNRSEFYLSKFTDVVRDEYVITKLGYEPEIGAAKLGQSLIKD